jgi:hypothetical protein
LLIRRVPHVSAEPWTNTNSRPQSKNCTSYRVSPTDGWQLTSPNSEGPTPRLRYQHRQRRGPGVRVRRYQPPVHDSVHSKPFTFGMALEEFGHAKVATHVGVEPSSDAFNSSSCRTGQTGRSTP